MVSDGAVNPKRAGGCGPGQQGASKRNQGGFMPTLFGGEYPAPVPDDGYNKTGRRQAFSILNFLGFKAPMPTFSLTKTCSCSVAI